MDFTLTRAGWLNGEQLAEEILEQVGLDVLTTGPLGSTNIWQETPELVRIPDDQVADLPPGQLRKLQKVIEEHEPLEWDLAGEAQINDERLERVEDLLLQIATDSGLDPKGLELGDEDPAKQTRRNVRKMKKPRKR